MTLGGRGNGGLGVSRYGSTMAAFGESLTVTRPGATTWANGVPSSASTTLTITASVQPLSGDDLLLLPEGERTKATVWIFTATELFPGNEATGTMPDVVTWRGTQYQVNRVEVWSETGLAHFRARASKIEQQGAV